MLTPRNVLKMLYLGDFWCVSTMLTKPTFANILIADWFCLLAPTPASAWSTLPSWPRAALGTER